MAMSYRPSTLLSGLRLAFLRGIVWSLIGMIYAPLFTGLVELLNLAGWDRFAYVVAASLTGAVCAVLYGARQVALISTGLGVVVGVTFLILAVGGVGFLQAVLSAAALAAILGLLVAFPERCSRHVAGKALAGLVAGATGGSVLAIAEPLHAAAFSVVAVVAFLVSVTGVLYVATVNWWVALTHRMQLEARTCHRLESSIMAILAAVGAGSVWMVSGPLVPGGEGMWHQASLAMHRTIPEAVLAGLCGGAIAGFLLQSFRFSWVHEL